jgi:hypothetical protein
LELEMLDGCIKRARCSEQVSVHSTSRSLCITERMKIALSTIFFSLTFITHLVASSLVSRQECTPCSSTSCKFFAISLLSKDIRDADGWVGSKKLLAVPQVNGARRVLMKFVERLGLRLFVAKDVRSA